MAAVANAYLEFAAEAPALYEAMFALTLNVPFGDTAVSPELPFAFSQILQLFSEQGTTAEVISELSGRVLDGIAELTRTQRFSPKRQ